MKERFPLSLCLKANGTLRFNELRSLREVQTFKSGLGERTTEDFYSSLTVSGDFIVYSVSIK